MKYKLLTLLLLNSCVLIPFTEPDAQAKGEITNYCPSISCTSDSRAQTKNYRKENFRITKLIRLLHATSDATRTNASTDLGNMGLNAIGAVPSLENLARRDPSKWVRRSAVKSLEKIGATSSIAVLEKVSKTDSNNFVRQSANNALLKMRQNTRRAQLR